MRLGALRFLACVGAGTLAWAVSRVPVVIERARADMAAAAAWQAGSGAAGVQIARVQVQGAGLRLVGVSERDIRTAAPLQVGLRAESRGRTAPLVRTLGPHRHDGSDDATASERPRPSASALLLPTETTAEVAARKTSIETPPATAFQLAATAYTDLARRDRRAAARGFDAALAADAAALNAPAWRTELRRLKRQWSGDAYILVRGAGPVGLGVAPLLGGGQSGATLAFTPDPLARRPLAVVGRGVVAHEGAAFGVAGIDRGSLQAALGLRWQVVPGASLTAERLIAVGATARDAWVVRAAGGAAGRVGAVRLDAYAEAGVVGARRRDIFASAQARAAFPLPAGFDAGAGTWASVQDAATTVRRVDIGPTIGWRAGPVTARADWRFRIAGNAAPESGPALTLSAAF